MRCATFTSHHCPHRHSMMRSMLCGRTSPRAAVRLATQRRSLVMEATGSPTVLFNLSGALDKAHETKSLKEILALPPSALQGVPDRADELLASLKITTVKDLAGYKYYKIAKAVATLAGTEAPAPPAGCRMNINKALSKKWEAVSMADLLKAPVSAFQGLTQEKAANLGSLGITTVADLAAYKYAAWAEAIVALSKYETEDFSSR